MKNKQQRKWNQFEADIKHMQLELNYVQYQKELNHSKTISHRLLQYITQVSVIGKTLLQNRIVVSQMASLIIAMLNSKKSKKK